MVVSYANDCKQTGTPECSNICEKEVLDILDINISTTRNLDEQIACVYLAFVHPTCSEGFRKTEEAEARIEHLSRLVLEEPMPKTNKLNRML